VLDTLLNTHTFSFYAHIHICARTYINTHTPHMCSTHCSTHTLSLLNTHTDCSTHTLSLSMLQKPSFYGTKTLTLFHSLLPPPPCLVSHTRCAGQYRVLKPGEDVPTINSLRRDSGQGLLSAANGSVMRVAKMRKGQVCVCVCMCAYGVCREGSGVCVWQRGMGGGWVWV